MQFYLIGKSFLAHKWMNGKVGKRTASFWRSLANTEQPEELIDICEKGGCGYVNPEVMLALGKYRWKEIDTGQYCYTPMLPY